MKKEIAEKILRETEAGYDLIAGKFSQTRKHFWTELSFLKDYVTEGDKVLDFGCGNGRLIELLGADKLGYSGVDSSQKLLDIASERYAVRGAKFYKIAGFPSLAFPDNYFNVVFSIAVFHHLPGKELRLDMAQELKRVLKPGGKIIITSWNLWQPKYSLIILANWIRKIIGKSELDWNDGYIYFRDNAGNRFNRFHHAFTRRELKKLFKKAGFQVEQCRLVQGRNWLLVGRA